MKSLLLVTSVDFWNKGSGHRTRISSMMSYLKGKVRITVFFAGVGKDNEHQTLRRNYPEINFGFAGARSVLTFKEYKEIFRHYITDKNFDIVLIEYVELSSVLEFLPEGTIAILDTHDIVYNKVESFEKYNTKFDGIILNKEEELNIFRCYDYIILIQKRDFECIAREIDRCKLLLAPHPPSLKKVRIRKKVQSVGYIASPYTPNIDALRWFINNVWDKVSMKYNLVLNIYGTICNEFYLTSDIQHSNIIFHGIIDDVYTFYERADIIINPVRFGAGLKIKNVEALGYGVPLITSTHGAVGLEDGIAEAFLTADSPQEYVFAFESLIKDFRVRKRLSNSAFEYAKCHFSERRCYEELVRIVTT